MQVDIIFQMFFHWADVKKKKEKKSLTQGWDKQG